MPWKKTFNGAWKGSLLWYFKTWSILFTSRVIWTSFIVWKRWHGYRFSEIKATRLEFNAKRWLLIFFSSLPHSCLSYIINVLLVFNEILESFGSTTSTYSLSSRNEGRFKVYSSFILQQFFCYHNPLQINFYSDSFSIQFLACFSFFSRHLIDI